MENHEGKDNKIKRISKILILVYIIFLLSVIINNGLSKYRTAYAKDDVKINVANPIANVVAQSELEITELHNEEIEWNFIVNNYNGTSKNVSAINEVELNYKIEISKGNLENLQYKLYKIDGQTKRELTLSNDVTDEEFELQNGNVQEDKFCLVIKTSDDVDQKGLQGNVNIKLQAIQKN